MLCCIDICYYDNNLNVVLTGTCWPQVQGTEGDEQLLGWPGLVIQVL